MCERPEMDTSMIGGGDDDCGGRSGVATMSSRIRVAEEASSSLRKAAFTPTSLSTTAHVSGVEDSHGRDGPEALGVRIDE